MQADTIRKPSARSTLLADASRDLGRTWATGWFDDLRREGRAVTGGWPGTMSEARGRTRFHTDALLTRRALPVMTTEELTEAARVTYDSAKALWLGGRVRDDSLV